MVDFNFELDYQSDKKWNLEYKNKTLNSEEFFKLGFKEGVDVVSEELFARVATFLRCNIYDYIIDGEDDIDINELIRDLSKIMEDNTWNF
jgi:hypothetical protein